MGGIILEQETQNDISIEEDRCHFDDNLRLDSCWCAKRRAVAKLTGLIVATLMEPANDIRSVLIGCKIMWVLVGSNISLSAVLML